MLEKLDQQLLDGQSDLDKSLMQIKNFILVQKRAEPNDFPWYDLAGLFYFNDDYEGGELYFPQHGIEFQPVAGAAYFFPGDMYYAHGVRPIKSGNRFTSPFFWTIVKHTGERQP